MAQLYTNKGITLVENLISILLIGMVASTAMYSQVSSQKYLASAKHHYQAINLARDEMENITAGEIILDPGNTYTRNVVIDNETALIGVINVDYSDFSNVEITVNWTDSIWTNIVSSETLILRL